MPTDTPETPITKSNAGAFFWVPLRYWPAILSAIGLYIFAIDLGWLPEPF